MKTKITLRTKITLTIATLLATAAIFYAGPTSFAPVGDGSTNGPIGVAAAPDLLLVTEYTGNLDTIDCSRKVSLLATIDASGSGLERYLAIAPSQSANATPVAFTPRDIFVTQGGNIYKIVGSSVTLFATLPGDQPDDRTGITFDHIGTFGYNMIVTTSDPINSTNGGKVYRVDGGGTPTLIADLSGTTQTLEGPAVVPTSFGTYGGQILVADEFYKGFGAVHAIDNAARVTYEVFDWLGAEGVVVIPSAQCAFCSTGGAFFQAVEDLGAVYQYPMTDFNGLGGNVLVTSEYGAGTALWDGNQGSGTSFNSSLVGINEGSAWADCDVPTPTPSPSPSPSTSPTPSPSATPVPTNLSVTATSGTYGGNSGVFLATLTKAADNSPIANATINFTLNGNFAGTATTNLAGQAKSNAVLLAGSAYNAGYYPHGAAASFAGDSSSGASNGDNSLTVNKAALLVSADNKTRPYGALNPPLTASYVGFVNSETLFTSGVMGQPALSTTATQYSAVGQYPITISLSSMTSSNYDLTPANGTLTVTLCGGVIIGLNKITIGASSALVDSYHSSIGYAASVDDAATLLSNGLITLQGAKVHGDVVAANGGNVVLQSGSLVTGDVVYGNTLSNSGSIQGSTYHQNTTPFVAPIPGACGSYTKAPTTWITGAYTYDPVKGNLTVSGGGTATMAAGTYCFNNVTVSGGSTLAFSGAVIINVTGKFTDSGGSLQNPSQIPSNLQVFSSYTGSNGVTVSGTSATYMSIYAPGTDVTVSGGSPFYGSLVGKTLTVSGNSAIHQDLDLPCWQ